MKSKGWPNTDPLWECTYDNTAERRKEILDKYEFLLLRYPNAWNTKASTPIVDEDGIPVRLDEKDLVVMGAKGQYGTIGLMITHWVDPEPSPPSFRSPTAWKASQCGLSLTNTRIMNIRNGWEVT